MPALFMLKKRKKLQEKMSKKHLKMYRHFLLDMLRLKRIRGGLKNMNFKKEKTSDLIDIYNQICNFLAFLDKEKQTAKIDKKEE